MLVFAPQGTQILSLTNEASLDQVASSIPAEEKGHAVFGSFESRGLLLLFADEGSGWHFLPEQGGIISSEDLLWKITSLQSTPSEFVGRLRQLHGLWKLLLRSS